MVDVKTCNIFFIIFSCNNFCHIAQWRSKWRKMSEHHGDFTVLYQAEQLLEIFESMDTCTSDIKLNKIEPGGILFLTNQCICLRFGR